MKRNYHAIHSIHSIVLGCVTAGTLASCGGGSGGVAGFFGDGGSRVTISGKMQGQTRSVCVSNPPATLTPAQIQDAVSANINNAFRWDSGTTLSSKIESDRSCNFDQTPSFTITWEQLLGATSNQQLSDWGNFTATIDAQGVKTINVCIRDTQCEDGDIIDITLNGGPVMRAELKNASACFPVAVTSGTNYLGVYAVNGTGFKGNCSFEDRNTGEVTVIGADGSSKVQTYSVTGGQGSYGEIKITN